MPGRVGAGADPVPAARVCSRHLPTLVRHVHLASRLAVYGHRDSDVAIRLKASAPVR
jgi:hypothetical protein